VVAVDDEVEVVDEVEVDEAVAVEAVDDEAEVASLLLLTTQPQALQKPVPEQMPQELPFWRRELHLQELIPQNSS
jgi:hypothetical protein